MTEQASGRSKRVEFIDLLRGWAVLVMIETHVVNATLHPDIFSTQFFQYLKFLNGLVAPSFLFASGLAYAITTRRKLNDYLALGSPLVRQIGRLSFVLIIAYALHLPKFSFSLLLNNTTPLEWQSFFQVDVLQAIAMSLLLLQGLLLLVRREVRFYYVTIILAALIVIATPLMWQVDSWEVIPWPIAAYLNGVRHSLFPLFPWAAFLFAGAFTGFLFLRVRENFPEEALRKYLWRMLIGATALIVASMVIEPFASRIYPTYEYWLTSPSFLLLRLGCVLLLTALMVWKEWKQGVSPKSVVTLIGRESFLVYVLHLLLIYGDFGKFNFQKWVNHEFGYPEAILTALLLVGLMYAIAAAWSRLRKRNPVLKRRVELLALAIVLGVFFFGPGE